MCHYAPRWYLWLKEKKEREIKHNSDHTGFLKDSVKCGIMASLFSRQSCLKPVQSQIFNFVRKECRVTTTETFSCSATGGKLCSISCESELFRTFLPPVPQINKKNFFSVIPLMFGVKHKHANVRKSSQFTYPDPRAFCFPVVPFHVT